MSKPIFLTFPIILLKDGINDIKECMDNAMDYCLYDKYLRFQKLHKYSPIDDAVDSLGIKYANIKKSIKDGKILYDSIDEKSPKTSVNEEMIFDFYKNKKSEFEVVCFLAFSALKSIIQKQQCKRITNEYLLSRMSGNSKTGEDIHPLLRRYTSRYQLNKVKIELQLNWGLKYYAVKTRGFYASFTMPIKALALIAVRNNKKYKLKKLEDEIKEATMKAIEQVMKEPLPANIKKNATSEEQNIDKT